MMQSEGPQSSVKAPAPVDSSMNEAEVQLVKFVYYVD